MILGTYGEDPQELSDLKFGNEEFDVRDDYQIYSGKKKYLNPY